MQNVIILIIIAILLLVLIYYTITLYKQSVIDEKARKEEDLFVKQAFAKMDKILADMKSEQTEYYSKLKKEN